MSHAPATERHPANVWMDEITPGLFLGNMATATTPDYLVLKGITHVLTLTAEKVTIPNWTGIVHRQFRVKDTRHQNLLQYLVDGIQFIEEAFTGVLPTLAPGSKNNDAGEELQPREEVREVRVFVHCRAGISRSGSVIVAYVMKHFLLTFNDALAMVRSRRSIVNPNHGFVSQLLLLYSANFDLAHLGPEIHEPTIDNPYNPDLVEIARLTGGRSKKKKRRENIPVWEKEPEKWMPVSFPTDGDRELFLECFKTLGLKGGPLDPGIKPRQNTDELPMGPPPPPSAAPSKVTDSLVPAAVVDTAAESFVLTPVASADKTVSISDALADAAVATAIIASHADVEMSGMEDGAANTPTVPSTDVTML